MAKKPNMPGGKPKLNFKAIGMLLKQVFKDFPVQIILIFLCLTVSAIVGIVPAVYIEILTRLIEEGLRTNWETVMPEILDALGAMIAIFAVGLISSFTSARLLALITPGFMHKNRMRMFEAMQKLPVKYFDSNNHGDIMSYYTNDTDTLRQAISQSFPQMFSSAISALAALVSMLWLSVPVTIFVLVFAAILFAVVRAIVSRSGRYFVKQQMWIGDVNAFVEESVNGQKVIKVFNHEDECRADFKKVNEELYEDNFKAHAYANTLGPIINNIGNVLYVLTAILGGLLMLLNGEKSGKGLSKIVSGLTAAVKQLPNIIKKSN